MDAGIRRLIPMYGIILIWGTAWSVSINGPVMPLYVNSLGISEKSWGLLAMSMATGMVLFEWFWGALSDRGNRLIYAVISMVAISLIFPLYTVQALIPYFFVLQFLFGSFCISMGPVSRSVVSDHSSPESLGMSMSLHTVFMTIGSMVGSILGAFIATTWGFHSTFYMSSILSAIGVATTAISMKRYGKQEEKPRIKIGDAMKAGFSNLLSNPSVRLLMIVSSITFMARTVIWTFLPLYASILIDMSTLEIGFLISLTSLISLVASVVVGKLSEKFGNDTLTLAGFLLAALFFFAYFFAKSAMHIYLISIMLSVCLSVSPLLTAMISELSPSEHMGMSMGIHGSFEDVGAMLGPAISGMVWAALSPKYIFIVSGVTQLIGAILVVLYKVKH